MSDASPELRDEIRKEQIRVEELERMLMEAIKKDSLMNIRHLKDRIHKSRIRIRDLNKKRRKSK